MDTALGTLWKSYALSLENIRREELETFKEELNSLERRIAGAMSRRLRAKELKEELKRGNK